MNPEKYTKKSLEAIQSAQSLAVAHSNQQIEQAHLLLAMLQQDGGLIPQLLQAASAAQSAFEEIKTAIAQKGGADAAKGRIVLATVKGDVHDIGKNIVRVILENYGFEVFDLGRDVPPERVVETVQRENAPLVGLSALMTTTVPAMEKTIQALHTLPQPPVIFVGGAVVTPEYARQMGADYYAKDARQSVEIARKVLG